MLIREIYIDATKKHRLGSTELYEPFTDDIKRLFKSLQKEYGRCVGHIYLDTKDGNTKKCGWVFSKKIKHEDCKKEYVREVWVELFDKYEEVTSINQEPHWLR